MSGYKKTICMTACEAREKLKECRQALLNGALALVVDEILNAIKKGEHEVAIAGKFEWKHYCVMYQEVIVELKLKGFVVNDVTDDGFCVCW